MSINLSMMEQDDFPVYVYGFPMQDFNHKELPVVFKKPPPRWCGPSKEWPITMGILTWVPASLWWLIITPKTRKNPLPLPAPLSMAKFYTFLLNVVLILASYWVLWYLNGDIFTVLKVLASWVVPVCFFVRRLALAMLERRLRVQIRELPDAKVVSGVRESSAGKNHKVNPSTGLG
eukprot:TRINITY_DN84248_c0_g1_i1.p1 TRINITY_DN84248_c0_g1~~TRINITY_DN84248_c0_g1_i1.p1  ORF type:complete len:191 (+),score=0.96 TRINITY_DN84248_c0_g1_i1:46-573(+)